MAQQTSVKMRVFIPRKLAFDPKALSRAINNTLDMAAEGIQADFGVTTQTWKNRPAFRIYRHGRDLTRYIYTEDEIYSYVNDGTRPHPITARNAPALAFFATGFRSKTVPRAIRSRKGAAANANFVRPITVQHPGNEARDFDKTIADKWAKEFPRQLQRAIDAEIATASNDVIYL